MSKNIYATCNGNIVIYGIENGEVIDTIKYVYNFVIFLGKLRNCKFLCKFWLEVYYNIYTKLNDPCSTFIIKKDHSYK